MKIANGIMVLVFLLSILVQVNDPDPLLWIFYYAVATLITAYAFFQRYTCLAAVAALAYFGGFACYVPGWGIDTVLLLREPKMSSIDVELAREAFGLLICALWMSVLTWVWYRRRTKAAEGGRNLA